MPDRYNNLNAAIAIARASLISMLRVHGGRFFFCFPLYLLLLLTDGG
jgi:hypothetical protein